MKKEEFKQALVARIATYAAEYRSQNELARKIGVTTGSMSAFLTSMQGYGVPMAIARECSDVSLEWLFRGIGTMYLGEVPTQVPESAPLPSPGHDPAVVKVLLNHIESQAVTIARLQEENTRYKAALNIK